jgi:hypothetical protein
MARVVAEIRPGVCGFTCSVTAASEDEQNVHLSVRSECENVQRFAALLTEVDAYREIQQGYEGGIHLAARSSLKGCCSGCVVPGGVFKSMQVAAGLALPVDCSIVLTRE